MNLDAVLSLAGGLGLILLGMKLMTDGLKVAAGNMLRRLLATWTKTPLRGLASGFLMTSMVQSSSAVTVAAIGFVNAGIMSFANTVWVVYGSNIGTTTTAWIVAFLGLKIKIKVLALPLIAVGTAMWLSRGVNRRAALGEALAGFGLFFLGIEILQGAFAGLEQGIDLQAWAAPGMLGQLFFVGIGFVMTLLMQSSSASMALVLTATAGGFVPLEQAAAAVIGANVGTTTTAAIAVIGATVNAKRVAAMHLVFNLGTGLVAFMLLPALVGSILHLRQAMHLDLDPVSVLALFHSVFNVLGVLLIGPITGRLVTFIKQKFRSSEEDAARLQYLDDTIIATPPLAVGALVQETARIGASALRMVYSALRCSGSADPCRELHREKAILDKLLSEVARFTAKLRKRGLPQETSETIPNILRALRYFTMVGESAIDTETNALTICPVGTEELEQRREKLLNEAITVSLHADPSDDKYSTAKLEGRRKDFEGNYQEMKQALLDAGGAGEIPVDQMVCQLDYLSHVHRMLDQATKGATLLNRLGRELGVYQAVPKPPEEVDLEP